MNILLYTEAPLSQSCYIHCWYWWRLYIVPANDELHDLLSIRMHFTHAVCFGRDAVAKVGRIVGRAHSLCYSLYTVLPLLYSCFSQPQNTQKRLYWISRVCSLLHKGMQIENDKVKRAIARGRTTGQYKLPYCELETVPPLLYNFAPIEGIAFYEEVAPTSIDLAGNALTSIPEELGSLAELASLVLRFLFCPRPLSLPPYELVVFRRNRHNQLASLPAAFAQLTSLQQLDVSANQLMELNLTGLPALRRLDCSRNGLASLDVSGCARLVELDASGCGLQSLPLAGCTGLVRLNLRGNRLAELPMLQNLQAWAFDSHYADQINQWKLSISCSFCCCLQP